MKSQLTNNIKRHLIVYIAVASLAIATPQFDARGEAEGGFFFMLEGRAGIPAGHSTPWAEEVGVGGQQILTPTDNAIYIDSDQRFSGRLGGGRRIGQWDFGVFYSGLQSLGQASATANGNGAYLPILGISGSIASGTSVNASSSITYTVLDFEAGYNLKLGQVDARLFGGVRFADIDQDINTNMGSNIGIWRDHRDVDFWGAGLRLGANASFPIRGSFGVTASISGAALFGEQDTRTFSEVSCLCPLQSGGISRNDFRVAGNFDGELGVAFNHAMSNTSTMIITLGYRAEAWLDVNDTQSGATFSGNVYGTRYADQIFHGPFLRGEWRFD